VNSRDSAMVKPIRISRSKSKDPDLDATLALIDIACEDYEDLDSIQQVAHLALAYESEVINGGHLQYFHNRGTERCERTIEVLGQLGDHGHASLLTRAFERWTATHRTRPESIEEYHEVQMEMEFTDLDKEMFDSSQAISGFLDDYRKAHESHFVEWLP
jgi:hypothetical protein